jgi:ABC-2 type transport system ATP-binding protein
VGPSEPVIEIIGLSKRYRRHTALDGLDLTVTGAGVHAYLGPNGSGKTTTLRVLMGLARADAGLVRIFGRAVPGQLADVIGQVGAVLDMPAFSPYLTARRNLLLLARTAGMSRGRVDEVLELVDLTDRARDRVGGYSLGLRQRLALAAALVKSPRLLLLDEPMNGLDPAGIHQVRTILRRLADTGTTVLFSTHRLAEVAQFADAVTIIARGRHVVTGPVGEVLALRHPVELRIRLDDPDDGLRVLGQAGMEVRQYGGALYTRDVPDPSVLTAVLAEHGLYVRELVRVGADLESVFLDLTAADVRLDDEVLDLTGAGPEAVPDAGPAAEPVAEVRNDEVPA